MKMDLVLPVELWEKGERVGRWRSENAARHGMKPHFAYEHEGDSEINHIYGARGEAAFAVAMDMEWPATLQGFRVAPDVDPDWEVRTTPSTRGLKVSTNDPAHRLVAFVLNEKGSPSYHMVGFVMAGWAQKNVPLTDPGNRKKPAHFVHLSKLSPFTEDFHELHGWARAERYWDHRAPADMNEEHWVRPATGWACLYCPTSFEGSTP